MSGNVIVKISENSGLVNSGKYWGHRYDRVSDIRLAEERPLSDARSVNGRLYTLVPLDSNHYNSELKRCT